MLKARALTRCVGAMAAAVLALAACGGGGSDGAVATPQSTAPATVNVQAAYANLVRNPHTLSLSGSNSQGVAMTATLSISQGSQVTSNSTLLDTAALTMSIYTSGTLAATGVSTVWQDVGTPNWVVSFHSADGTCTLRTGGTGLPTSAALGSSGAYITGTEYPGCSASNMPKTFWLSSGTVTTTWTYSSVNGAGFVCFNSSDAQTFGTTTESDCIEVVDTAGTLGTHARVTVKDLNGVTTTLSN